MNNEEQVLKMKLEEIQELEENLNSKKDWTNTDEFKSLRNDIKSAIVDLVDDKVRREKFLREFSEIRYIPMIFTNGPKTNDDILMEIEAFNRGIANLKNLLNSLKKYFERLIKYSKLSEDTEKSSKGSNGGDCIVKGDGNSGNLVGSNNHGNTFNIINISNDEIKYTKEAREELIKCDIDEPVKESLISELDKIEIAKKTGKSTTEHIGSFLKIAAPYIGCISNVIGLVAKL